MPDLFQVAGGKGVEQQRATRTQHSGEFTQEAGGILHPLEGGSGDNEVEKAGKGDLFGISDDKGRHLLREKGGDLRLAAFAEVVEEPFVDHAVFFQQTGKAACAATDLEGAPEMPVRVMRQEGAEAVADLLLRVGVLIVCIERLCEAGYNSFHRFHR